MVQALSSYGVITVEWGDRWKEALSKERPTKGRPMAKEFTESERAGIVQQARANTLNKVRCPREGCDGRVLPYRYRGRDIPETGSRGALYDRFDGGEPRYDVVRASVECIVCGYGAANLDLSEEPPETGREVAD